MIKCCIGVAVPTVAVVLSEVFVLFVKDIGLEEEEEEDIVELESGTKGIQVQRITPKTNDMIISFLLINW
jgi:phosphoenolpyruvate synthase/pyruvate phosphate dikinase